MENVEALKTETGEERSSSTEVQITLIFLGPSISGCEVEKIAAGQPRRG